LAQQDAKIKVANGKAEHKIARRMKTSCNKRSSVARANRREFDTPGLGHFTAYSHCIVGFTMAIARTLAM
jgi:hypothetical protein